MTTIESLILQLFSQQKWQYSGHGVVIKFDLPDLSSVMGGGRHCPCQFRIMGIFSFNFRLVKSNRAGEWKTIIKVRYISTKNIANLFLWSGQARSWVIFANTILRKINGIVP